MSVSVFCSLFFVAVSRAEANDDSTRTSTVAREAMGNTTPTVSPPMGRVLMARPTTWSKEMAAMVSEALLCLFNY